MLPPRHMRLPSLAAFTSAVEHAVLAVRNACTSAQRRVAAFFGSSSNSSASTTHSATATAASATVAFTAPRAAPIPSRVGLRMALDAAFGAAPVRANGRASTAARAVAVATTTGSATTNSAVEAPRPLRSQIRLPLVTRNTFSPDQDESQAELVVFGPPRFFQSAGEYDLRLYDADDRDSRIHEPMPRVRLHGRRDIESFLVRPNDVLVGVLNGMSANPIISPQDPVDPATQFCSCGFCPHGIAATQECTFLTIFRREQRFRRRAATSLVIGAINRWHSACSTRPAFGRMRC